MWFNYSVCFFVLTSCGHSVIRDTAFFDAYITSFEQESIIYGNAQKIINLIIKFETTLPKNIAGRCTENATPLVQINVTTWEYISPERKELLIFHELGHCILGKGHDDTKLAIMNTNLLESYGNKRTELLIDFFRR